MHEEAPKADSYRWVVLAAYSLLNAVAVMQWLTFAPITGEAAGFYGVTPMKIGLFSMVAQILYLVLSIPASYIVDTWGIRRGIGFGAVLTGGFGFARGYFGARYDFVLVATIGFTVAQPIVFNSMTALCARWFPLRQRVTAAGVASFFGFAGTMVAMGLTPVLTIAYGIPGMLKIYGFLSLAVATLFCALVRERPLAPPAGSHVERVPVLAGIKHILTSRNPLLLMAITFVMMGSYTVVMTWVEQIIAPRGFDMIQAGTLGTVMQLGGIVGCFIVPPLSDKYGRRKPFLAVSVLGVLPGLLGLAFATGYGMLLAAGFCFGLFLMGFTPVVYQFSAELGYPAPEATSQGMLLWAGNLSGAIFVYGADLLRSASGAMTPSLLSIAALTAMMILPLSLMKETRGPQREVAGGGRRSTGNGSSGLRPLGGQV